MRYATARARRAITPTTPGINNAAGVTPLLPLFYAAAAITIDARTRHLRLRHDDDDDNYHDGAPARRKAHHAASATRQRATRARGARAPRLPTLAAVTPHY